MVLYTVQMLELVNQEVFPIVKKKKKYTNKKVHLQPS